MSGAAPAPADKGSGVADGSAAPEQAEEALAEANVQRFMEGKTVRKVIHVPDRLLNIGVGG